MLRIVRGVVQTADGTVVVNALPDNVEKITAAAARDRLTFPFEGFHSYEVALLRMYHFAGRWRLSTSRKLDAHQSFWASDVSFGARFEALVARATGADFAAFEASLDPAKRYFFLMPLTGAQRCGALRDLDPAVFWLAATQTGDQVTLDPADEGPWRAVPRVRFETPDELEEFLRESSVEEVELTGVMARDLSVRVVKDDYLERYQLRGNEPDVCKRYLELYGKKGVDTFYAQHEARLDEFARALDQLVVYVHARYIERFVRKQYTVLPKRIHTILRACHGVYLETRAPVTPARVRAAIHSFPPRFILNTLAERAR